MYDVHLSLDTCTIFQGKNKKCIIGHLSSALILSIFKWQGEANTKIIHLVRRGKCSSFCEDKNVKSPSK